MLSQRITPRGVLLVVVALMWANYATTGRWSHIVGALHGAKEPVFVAFLALASLLALRRWTPRDVPPIFGWIAFAAGTGLLLVSFFQWFPPPTWTQIPFLDNWPTRFQSTLEGIALYLRGAAVGWRWEFLGGYNSSSDFSQPLSTIAFLPVLLFGERVGFHVLHLFLLFTLPLLVYLDLRLDRSDREVPKLAAGLAALTVTGWFSYFMTRSGDTNSMAGAWCAMAALTGSHGLSAGRRWGLPLFVGAMALIGHCHAGFAAYTTVLLVVEAAFYRDRRRLLRAFTGLGVALLAALPLSWESWRYPSFFSLSNSGVYVPEFVLSEFLRQVYYNVEINFLPHRWFNDFAGLLRVMLPAIALVAWRSRGRAGFYAWATLAAMGLMFLNHPIFGFAFGRPIHLLAMLPAAPIAAFLLQLRLPVVRLAAFCALIAVYVQVSWNPVPHVDERRDLDPQLVDYVRSLDGAMVLLENAFHRDMDADLSRRPERTPFQAHIEATLARETGKRFFAGIFDGWQYTMFRAHLLANGAFQGRLISTVPAEDVEQTLRRWGIRHVVVWSQASTGFFSAQPNYARRWTHDRWSGFELLDADAREVVVGGSGAGELADRDWLGATVRLTNVRAGDEVVLRTNFFPAWTASDGTAPVPLFSRDGQLAFVAPRAGTYEVALKYPTRPWLALLAFLALPLGVLLCRQRREPRT